MYRLYRDSTRYEKGVYHKDLSRLNRDLSKVLVLETDPSRVNQQDNVIQLSPWKGDLNDKELLAYLPFLESESSLEPSSTHFSCQQPFLFFPFLANCSTGDGLHS